MNTQELLEGLKWRYAAKKFDSTKKVSNQDWQGLEQSLVLTPSSFGLQPWKFVVVTDQAMKEKLKPACWNQPQVTECSHFVVFMTLNNMTIEHADKHLAAISKLRGTPLDSLKGFRDTIEGFMKAKKPDEMRRWVDLQAYIALGSLMTSAAMLKIDTCPMEGIIPDKVEEILKIDGFHSVVACAVGYRSSEDMFAKMAKVRFEASQIVTRI